PDAGGTLFTHRWVTCSFHSPVETFRLVASSVYHDSLSSVQSIPCITLPQTSYNSTCLLYRFLRYANSHSRRSGYTSEYGQSIMWLFYHLVGLCQLTSTCFLSGNLSSYSRALFAPPLLAFTLYHSVIIISSTQAWILYSQARQL